MQQGCKWSYDTLLRMLGPMWLPEKLKSERRFPSRSPKSNGVPLS